MNRSFFKGAISITLSIMLGTLNCSMAFAGISNFSQTQTAMTNNFVRDAYKSRNSFLINETVRTPLINFTSAEELMNKMTESNNIKIKSIPDNQIKLSGGLKELTNKYQIKSNIFDGKLQTTNETLNKLQQKINSKVIAAETKEKKETKAESVEVIKDADVDAIVAFLESTGNSDITSLLETIKSLSSMLSISIDDVIEFIDCLNIDKAALIKSISIDYKGLLGNESFMKLFLSFSSVDSDTKAFGSTFTKTASSGTGVSSVNGLLSNNGLSMGTLNSLQSNSGFKKALGSVDISSLLQYVSIDIGAAFDSMDIDFNALWRSNLIKKLLSEKTVSTLQSNSEENYKILEKNISNLPSEKVKLSEISEFIDEVTATYSEMNGFSVGEKITSATRLVDLCILPYTDDTLGPIGIVSATLTNSEFPAGKKVYLISLQGTNFDAKEATGIEEDVLSAFYLDNEYVDAILAAIEEAKIEKGADVIITGLSLGGMVAQQVAGEIKDTYNVTNVICFGSPIIAPDTIGSSTKVVRFSEKHDAVPILVMDPSKITDKNTENYTEVKEDGGCKTTIGAHVLSYVDEDTWGEYDVFGTKGGNATITLNEKITFYAAPKK